MGGACFGGEWGARGVSSPSGCLGRGYRGEGGYTTYWDAAPTPLIYDEHHDNHSHGNRIPTNRRTTVGCSDGGELGGHSKEGLPCLLPYLPYYGPPLCIVIQWSPYMWPPLKWPNRQHSGQMSQNIQNWENIRNTTSQANLGMWESIRWEKWLKVCSNILIIVQYYWCGPPKQLFVYKQRPFFTTFMGFIWCCHE